MSEFGLSINAATGGLRGALVGSSERQLKLAGQNYRDIVELYKSGQSAEIARINQKLAVIMHEAVLEAYRSNVVARRSAPSYRRGDSNRFAGKLFNALEDPGMVVGTEEGIFFINTHILDGAARHWARLNFGAEPAIGRVPGFGQPKARLRFGSNQGFNLRLSEGPGSGFNVPQFGKGFFNTKGQLFLGKKFPKKKDEYVPVVGKPSKTGISPRRYLDAGLVALADNFGPVYQVEIQKAKDKMTAELVKRQKEAQGRTYGYLGL